MFRKLGVTAALVLLISALGACRVEQTREGELPEVDVQGGQAPAYDVDAADVDVNSRTTTATVPDVDVDTETTQVEVPDVDVNPPSDNPQQ